ncbi:hypothetical protein HMPREF3230_00421 [Gardnerella vaginalis]|uniref:Uncharacterized protein n=1 Tax=Gardnerella vaginalis TaxID=2702 RepID=A0A135Z964_GARVA|nr:hypothetical protein HMPREF3230_00421 [Gardnerella vaginalis]
MIEVTETKNTTKYWRIIFKHCEICTDSNNTKSPMLLRMLVG